jgi:hypothetical protein
MLYFDFIIKPCWFKSAAAASFIFMLGLFWVLFRRVEREIVFFLLPPHFRLGRRLWGEPGEAAGSIRCWKDLAVSLSLSRHTRGDWSWSNYLRGRWGPRLVAFVVLSLILLDPLPRPPAGQHTASTIHQPQSKDERTAFLFFFFKKETTTTTTRRTSRLSNISIGQNSKFNAALAFDSLHGRLNCEVSDWSRHDPHVSFQQPTRQTLLFQTPSFVSPSQLCLLSFFASLLPPTLKRACMWRISSTVV